jgi:hypothetical protein
MDLYQAASEQALEDRCPTDFAKFCRGKELRLNVPLEEIIPAELLPYGMALKGTHRRDCLPSVHDQSDHDTLNYLPDLLSHLPTVHHVYEILLIAVISLVI